jgi:hypothetical protein
LKNEISDYLIMKRSPIDPADLALERARQLKAVQLSRNASESSVPASTPEDILSSPESVSADLPPDETTTTATKHEKLPPRKKTTYELKPEKRWKTSVQLSKRHEKIVNEVVMHYRMQGLRPVSVNTIILAALEVLKRTPELDKVVHAIVAADKRVTRLS